MTIIFIVILLFVVIIKAKHLHLNGMHDAHVDAAVAAKCLFKMIEINWINVDFLKERETAKKTV